MYEGPNQGSILRPMVGSVYLGEAYLGEAADFQAHYEIGRGSILAMLRPWCSSANDSNVQLVKEPLEL